MFVFLFKPEGGIRDSVASRGRGDGYKRRDGPQKNKWPQAVIPRVGRVTVYRVTVTRVTVTRGTGPRKKNGPRP